MRVNVFVLIVSIALLVLEAPLMTAGDNIQAPSSVQSVVQSQQYVEPTLQNLTQSYESLNGQTVAVANQGSFVGYNDPTGQLPRLSYVYTVQDVNGMSYDPANGCLYISDGGSGGITIVNASTNRIVGFIQGSTYFGKSIYDPFNGYLYVIALYGHILVINTTENDIIATISGFNIGYSYFLDLPASTFALDTTNHDLYFKTVHRTTGTLYRIDTASQKIVKQTNNVGVGGALGYSAQTDNLYLAKRNGQLQVISPYSLQTAGNINFTAPSDIMYSNAIYVDPNNSLTYIESYSMNSISGNFDSWDDLTIINSYTGNLVENIKLGGDAGYLLGNTMVHDSSGRTLTIAGGIHVWRFFTSNNSVVNISGKVTDPLEMAINPENGTSYGGNYNGYFWLGSNSENTSVYNQPIGRPVSAIYDRSTNNIYIGDQTAGYLTVINASTDHITGRLNLNFEAYNLASNDFNGQLLLTRYNGAEVVNPKTAAVVHHFNSSGILPDSINGNYFIFNGKNFTALSWETWQGIYTKNVTEGIVGMGFDKYTNEITILTKNKSIMLFNGTTGSFLKEFHTTITFTVWGISNFAYSKDCMFIASGANITKFNLSNGKEIWSNHDYIFTQVNILYDPYNNMLYVDDAFTSYVHVIDASNGKSVFTYSLQNEANGIALDPDNQGVFVASSNLVLDPSSIVVLNYSFADFNQAKFNSMAGYPFAAGTIAILAAVVVAMVFRKFKTS